MLCPTCGPIRANSGVMTAAKSGGLFTKRRRAGATGAERYCSGLVAKKGFGAVKLAF